MADLLQLLKEHTVNRKNIVETETEVIFGDFAWPKTAKTNYVIWGSDKGDSTKDFYTLDGILYLLKHVDLPHAQYIRQAAAAGVPGVRLPDRRELLSYLHGDVATTNSIDRAAPVDISLRRAITQRSNSELDHRHRGGQSGDGQGDGRGLSGDSRTDLLGDSNNLMEGRSEAKRSRLDEEAVEREKRRLAAKLDAPSNKALMADQVKGSSLSEAMPLDKIQSIRAKFRANMQQTIKSDDVEIAEAAGGGGAGGVADGQGGGGVGGTGGREGTSRGPLLAADMNMVREIVNRERKWKTRVTVLQSHGKDFFESVVQGILRNVKMKEEGVQPGSVGVHRTGTKGGPVTPTTRAHHHHGHTAHGGGHHSHGHHSHGHHGHSTLPGTAAGNAQGAGGQAPVHYSRYDQERFTGGQELDTAGFKIDKMGTFHGMPLTSMMSGTGSGGGKEGVAPGVRSTADPRTARVQQSSGGGANPTATHMTPDHGGERRGYRSASEARMSRSQKSRSRIPIILIPAATSSLITMYNAKDILQDLRYVTTEEKKASGYKRDNEVLIQRMKPDGTTVPYRVVDQPLKLSPDEWDRVVSVFVQGPAWQFKGWPIGSDPVVILNMLKAFHLKLTRMPVDPNVSKWNVHVLQLDERRHLDKANFQNFWDILDKHMTKNKPHLRF